MSAVVAPSDSTVNFTDVVKEFSTKSGTVTALSDVNLEIPSGQFVTVVGPSGCGKSTLLTALAGLSTPTRGKIVVFGEEVSGPLTDAGIVFQNAELLPWRTARENVLLQAEMRKLDKSTYREKADDLLAQVGLSGFEDKFPHELSGGMQQRVALCRALLHDPSIILMDEPLGALDAMTRSQVQSDLQDLWMATKKTVLFITHSIEEAVFLGDRVLVMSPRPGRVVEDIEISLPRPRTPDDRETTEFLEYTREIRHKFTELGVFNSTY